MKYPTEISEKCSAILIAALVFALSQQAYGESAALTRARYQIMAGQFLQARTTLLAEWQTAPEGEQKDLARVLWSEVPPVRHGRGEKEPDIGLPKSETPAVQAEKLRARIGARFRTGARSEVLDLSQTLLQQYPAQFTDLDLWMAVQAGALSQQKGATQAWLAVGEKRFPTSPLLLWAKTLPLHWSAGACEGKRLLAQAEPALSEPLRSMARLRKLTFLRGDADDPHRVEQAQQVYRQILAAGQYEATAGLLDLQSMLRTVSAPQGLADWLAGLAQEFSDPGIAIQLRAEAVKEYMAVGQVDAARAKVAQWRHAGIDTGPLKEYLEKNAWKIAGTLPAELRQQGTDWTVAAMMPALASDEGQILVSTRAPVDEAGRFQLSIGSLKIEALLALARRPSGVPLVRKLAGEIKPGPGRVFHYPEDLPPTATMPAQTAEHSSSVLPLVERFGSAWPAQLVEITVPHAGRVDRAVLRVLSARGESLPCQLLKEDSGNATIGVWHGLQPNESARLRVVFDGAGMPEPPTIGQVTVTAESDGMQVVDTGPAQFRIPAGTHESPADAAKVAFLQAVKGPDGRWRGAAHWDGPSPPTRVSVKVGLGGPIRTSFVCQYAFANGAQRTVALLFDAGQPVVQIDEQGTGPAPGEFRFDLEPREGFAAYFGLIRSARWIEPLVKRTPALGMNLKDYAYFSTFSNFMAGGVMATDPRSKDAVTFFAVHQGDWFDPSYTEAFTPLDENPDLPWDHPGRYTGSMNSAIQVRVARDGEFPVRLPLAPGTRRWGVAVTDRSGIQDRDAGRVWDIETMLFRYNDGDLTRYAAMVLDWPETSPAGALRQALHRRLGELPGAKEQGLLALARAECQRDWLHQTFLPRMLLGVQEGDPVRIYNGWQIGLARLRRLAKACSSPQTIHVHGYDPVGGRSISECYLASLVADELGLLDEPGRAEVRRSCALIAYRLLSPDFMNYRMNAGQPNFEADRLLQLAVFAAAFPDHPMSPTIRQHVLQQTAEMLRQWTIRDGGKWGENIGTYYGHSVACVARLCHFLHYFGRIDAITDSPYFEPFCRYASNMLMSPQPADTHWLKSDAFDPPTRWIRLLPGVGSHGGEGGVPAASCPTPLLAQLLEKDKPALAANLLGVWQASGNSMKDGFGQYAAEYWLFGRESFGTIPPLDLQPRRMPGWGMIFRDAVGTDREFYLAFHAGTAAYRDDGFGGAMILHALGRPLSLDGGDDADAAVHSTMLMQMRPGQFGAPPLGKVTRWLISPAVQFARGEFSQGAAGPDRYSRDVLFARNDYVLIHDEQNTRFPGVFNFVTPAATVEPRSQGIFCAGKLGVDLWLMPLADVMPRAEIEPIALGNERVTELNKWRQIAVRIPFAQSSSVLLHPVRSGAKPATVEKLGENVWRISGANFRDLLFTGDGQAVVPGIGAVKFHGTLGLLRTHAGTWNFSLLNGQSVRVGEHEFSAATATTFFSDGRTTEGH
jgi:hypothetical protein